MAAAIIAVIVTVIVTRGPAAAPGSVGSAQSSPPPAGAPVIGGPGVGNGGNGGTLMLGAVVSKVSSSSITLTAGGYLITAAITNATKFTGVTAASQIKPGDQVIAQLSGYGSGHPVVAAIQDPGQRQ